MDRYVTRERRIDAEYPEGNQGIPFPTTSIGNNITMPEHVYYNNYNPMHNQDMYNYNAGAMMPQMQTYLPNINRQDFPEYHVMQPAHNNIMPGIDHRYLAFTDNNAAYMTGQTNTVPVSAFVDYQNRNFIGADRTDSKHYTRRSPNVQPPELFNDFTKPMQKSSTGYLKAVSKGPEDLPKPMQKSSTENLKAVSKGPEVTPKKQLETDLLKTEPHNVVKTRAEKLKELHKTGTRVFCGSVENVLKWHKMIQDIGVTVLYDIVGKCVSIRPGESCAKNLVVRDENGPAMQIVYYEIDFLLPKLQVPCTVRVVGRMLAGSSRLQAFSVRAARGDDGAALARRAACAAHHVARLARDHC